MPHETTPDVESSDRQEPASERASALERLRRSRRRTFYSIGEVCAMVGVKPHVLRYWETQFDELSPSKNRSGNRVYQADEIELIALIHRLVHEERYTVEGARKKIAELQEEGSSTDEASDALQRMFLRTLEDELREVYRLLDPSGVEPDEREE